MINKLYDWCVSNCMSVNISKSNIVHFRRKAKARTDYQFLYGDETLSFVEQYKYLGLVLNEHFDINVTVKMVAQSASRALGLLIAKYKSMGGMPYRVYSKLYDSMVWSVIDYGAAVWGDKTFSCINAVHNRAMRFFVGLGKYAPTAAVSGDMGWQQPETRQWMAVSRQWHRLMNMDNARVNYTVFKWCKGRSTVCRN